MRGISIKAIVLATLAVFGIDIVSGMMLTQIFGPSLLSLPEDEARIAMEALNQNHNYLVAALLLGTASTAVGGYLTARISDHVPYFNALGFGAVGLLLGIFMTDGLPPWFRLLGLGLTLPAALLGAHLGKQRR